MRKSVFFESRYFPSVFILLSFVFLLVYSFSTSPLYPFQGFDSATFRTIGLGIIHGKLPYVDLFDHKGPLIFYIDALGMWLLPGKWGIFLLQVFSLSASLYFIYLTGCLFSGRRTSFYAVLLSLVPLIDFIVEGNQCEEWMLPMISVSVYLSMSWLLNCRECPHPLWYSILYGIAFSVLFFIRPNDAVASIGAVMTGVFICLLVSRQYGNALMNALAFFAGVILSALPICAYFASHGILEDMLYGTIFYNIKYSEAVTLRTFGIGMVLIPLVVAGTSIFLGLRDKKTSAVNFILVPYLIFTLIFIGKRDYYHYLIPLLPYVTLFFILCLKHSLRSVVIAVSVLFLAGSFYQQKQLVRIVMHGDEIRELYAQTDRLFGTVPESERNSVWNLDLYAADEGRPRIYSLHGAYLHAGVTPGNRIFVKIHLPNFGADERVAAHRPKWVMSDMDDPENEDSKFVEDNYELVAVTDGQCPRTIGLYRKIDEKIEATAF